ncbi:MAG TPA: hypothetical protein VF179_13580, partial [Thermoanaerobaculia bacterium]|nr:hypothetical protein [Thermoanaerobaculia bacterium]
MRYVRLGLAVSTLLLLPLLAGCRGQEPDTKEAWFVHATDPHLFYDDKTEKWNPAVREHQEGMNQQAFADLIQVLGSPPGMNAKPAFLVMTGDFGIDRFWQQPASTTQQAPVNASQTTAPSVEPTPTPTPAPTTPSSNSGNAVKHLVSILAKSPVDDIYLVPGNNDVGQEVPVGKGVDATQAFWAEVQNGLKDTGIILHDLTSCYFGGGLPSGCYVDANDSYRLVGFPSHSFKDGVTDDRAKAQLDQLNKLETLIGQAAEDGKRVLIVTHIPEVDDPHTLAVKEFDLVERYPKEGQAKVEKQVDRAPDLPDWAQTSPWNVRKAAFDKWKQVVDSPAVAGVLAGHFHDSHKEIYRQPYSWAGAPAERASLARLYLSPPLSMRFQNQSPIQARGFALFQLRGNQDPDRVLFWYDRKLRTFQADQPTGGGSGPEPTLNGSSRSTPAALAFLWDLGVDKGRLARAVVFAIAFLAAFLTVVEVWQIPPPNTRPVRVVREAQPNENGTVVKTRVEVEAEKGQAATFSSYGATALLFQTNFARTVLSGLAGLALVSAFDGLWRDMGIQEKPYFLVLFVIYFAVILFSSALLRAGIEAFRSRISLVRRMPGRPSDTNPALQQWAGYWVKRLWFWMLSLRTALLCFGDTFFNVIQGKNQLHTAEFENDIARLHESIVGAVDRVRQDLDRAFVEALERRKKAHEERKKKEGEGVEKAGEEAMWVAPLPKPADVRVNISLLSEDESTVFYVSREEGSLAQSFGTKSIAWVALFNSRALWWKETYKGRRIALIEGKPPLFLHDYYEPRASADYKGFVILPVPWGRGPEGGRKAGIHVSFRSADYMRWLWNGLDPYEHQEQAPQDGVVKPEDQQDQNKHDSLYESWTGLLEFRDEKGDGIWLLDRELSKILRQSVSLLTELLRFFN